MENTLQRIKKFIDYKGISIRMFEQSIGISNGSFASQLKNNRTIGVDKLENILQIYSEINPEWLLTGTGFMLKKEYNASRDNNIVNGENKGVVGNYGTIGNVGDTGIGQMSGGCVHDNEINNYHGFTRDDLVSMMEERFQHMLKKEEDIRNIFEENRKLTDEMLRQNDEFRKKNEDYRDAIRHINELHKRIDLLTDKLIDRP